MNEAAALQVRLQDKELEVPVCGCKSDYGKSNCTHGGKAATFAAIKFLVDRIYVCLQIYRKLMYIYVYTVCICIYMYM